MTEPTKTDFSHADNTGVSLGSNWGVIIDSKLVNVVDERTVPSVVDRIFNESKQSPETLFVLGRFIFNGLSLEEMFMHNETWHLIQNGKIAVLGADYMERYHESVCLPAFEHWVLLPDREEAYHQYVIKNKF